MYTTMNESMSVVDECANEISEALRAYMDERNQLSVSMLAIAQYLFIKASHLFAASFGYLLGGDLKAYDYDHYADRERQVESMRQTLSSMTDRCEQGDPITVQGLIEMLNNVLVEISGESRLGVSRLARRLQAVKLMCEEKLTAMDVDPDIPDTPGFDIFPMGLDAFQVEFREYFLTLFRYSRRLFEMEDGRPVRKDDEKITEEFLEYELLREFVSVVSKKAGDADDTVREGMLEAFYRGVYLLAENEEALFPVLEEVSRYAETTYRDVIRSVATESDKGVLGAELARNVVETLADYGARLGSTVSAQALFKRATMAIDTNGQSHPSRYNLRALRRQREKGQSVLNAVVKVVVELSGQVGCLVDLCAACVIARAA